MFKSMRFGSLVVSLTNETDAVKTKLLNDGTDGIRYDILGADGYRHRGVLRFTRGSIVNGRSNQLNEEASATFCEGGTFAKLAGMGIRLYVELRQPVRKLHSTFAG